MLRNLNLLRKAFWNAAARHGVFMMSKGAAYSSILTIFPFLIIVSWVLAETHTTTRFFREISFALGLVLPPGSSTTVLGIFQGTQRPLKEIFTASTIMIFAASGIMISWMEGFRRAYGISVNPWGFWRERGVALLLVFLGFAPMVLAMVLVAFGNVIETWVLLHMRLVPKVWVLFAWSMSRWLISGVASVTAIMLIYHWGLPRIQPWHRVLPGAIVATCLWFPASLVFGWYVTRYASYNLIYGPLGAGIALLVLLYIVSITILIGAEFNAVACPRTEAVDEDERRDSDRRRAPRRRA
jgi:membrane protein